jgi:hypothetical protein
MKNYETELHRIKQLSIEEEYSLCIKECGYLFESALKELKKKLQAEILNQKEKIKLEHYIDLQDKKYNRFTLGDLSIMFQKNKLWDILSRTTKSNLIRTKSIDWKKITVWRNEEVHIDKNKVYSKQDRFDKSILLITWLKYFLIDTEFIIKVETEETAQNKIEISAMEEYENICKGCWFDGIVNIKERQYMEFKRRELKLSVRQARDIEKEIANKETLEYTGEVQKIISDGEITSTDREYLKIKAKELGISPWLQKQVEENIRSEFNESTISIHNPLDVVWTRRTSELS